MLKPNEDVFIGRLQLPSPAEPRSVVRMPNCEVGMGRTGDKLFLLQPLGFWIHVFLPMFGENPINSGHPNELV